MTSYLIQDFNKNKDKLSVGTRRSVLGSRFPATFPLRDCLVCAEWKDVWAPKKGLCGKFEKIEKNTTFTTYAVRGRTKVLHGDYRPAARPRSLEGTLLPSNFFYPGSYFATALFSPQSPIYQSLFLRGGIYAWRWWRRRLKFGRVLDFDAVLSDPTLAAAAIDFAVL